MYMLETDLKHSASSPSQDNNYKQEVETKQQQQRKTMVQASRTCAAHLITRGSKENHNKLLQLVLCWYWHLMTSQQPWIIWSSLSEDPRDPTLIIATQLKWQTLWNKQRNHRPALPSKPLPTYKVAPWMQSLICTSPIKVIDKCWYSSVTFC